MAHRDVPEDLSEDLPDADDLDQYGVWVKSGPEDMALDMADDVGMSVEIDNNQDSFLSEEEENLLEELHESDLEEAEFETPAQRQETEEDPMSDTENKDNLEQEEFSIEIPDIDDEVNPISLGSDDDLQAQLDSIDLDNLDDEDGDLSISLDVGDDDEELYFEEGDLQLDLDEDIDTLPIRDIEEEDDISDLEIPDLDGLGSDSEEETISIPPLPENLDTGSSSGDLPLEEVALEDDFEGLNLDLGQEEDIPGPQEEDSSPEKGDLDLGELPDLDEDFLDIGDETIDLEAYDKDKAASESESMDLGDLDDFETRLPEDETEIVDLDTDFSFEETPDEALPALDEAETSLPGAEEDSLSIDQIHEPDFSESLPELDNFDDVEAFADEIANESEEEPMIAVIGTERTAELPEAGTVRVDPGSSILSAIEHELAAIKSELSGLRQELRTLREQEAALKESISKSREFPQDEFDSAQPDIMEEDLSDESFDPEAGPGSSLEGIEDIESIDAIEVSEAGGIEELPDEEESTGGGFFDDDEDETIALTGDELDNILNTAEFVEEAGQPSEVEDEGLVPDGVLEANDEVPVDELEGSVESNGVDEIELEEVELDSPASGPDPFRGSDDAVKAMAELDIEKELEGIDDLQDESVQFDFDEEELEKMSIEIPDSFSEEEIVESPPDGFEPDLSQEESDILQEEISEEYQEAFPEDKLDEEVFPDPMTDEIPGGEEAPQPAAQASDLSASLKDEIKSVLAYMDKLLEALPEEKIEEFARSEHFEVYKRLFEELGL